MSNIMDLERAFIVDRVFYFENYVKTEEDQIDEDFCLTTIYQTGFTVSVSERIEKEAGIIDHRVYDVFFNRDNKRAPEMMRQAFKATHCLTNDQVIVERTA